MEELNALYNKIGNNVKKFRKNNGDSQEDLANKLNMSRGFISQIESSKIKKGISIETLYKISKLYNTNIINCFK